LLLLDGVALNIDDSLQPPRQKVYEVLHFLDAIHPQHPELVISRCKSFNLLALEPCSCTLIQAQTFSMVFRSGLLLGKSISVMCGLSLNQALKIFYMGQGAPFCRKYDVSCCFMKISSFSSRMVRSLAPFIISPLSRKSWVALLF
jgi:hypothetical protein